MSLSVIRDEEDRNMNAPPPFPLTQLQWRNDMLDKTLSDCMFDEANSNTVPLPACLVIDENEVFEVES